MSLTSISAAHGSRNMRREEILSHYTWSLGICFRHPATGEVETAAVKAIHPRHGGCEEVRACRNCVLEMEEQRRVAALEVGLPYQPGHAGEDLGSR